MARVEIKIPDWLDKVFAWPAMVYRKHKYGYPYRKIPLGEGRFTIVDPPIFCQLNQFNWVAKENNQGFYAFRFINEPGKPARISSMHREIMGFPKGYLVDHKNNNKLDNRLVNLRLATRSQNACNTLKRRTNTSSKYRGVSWRKDIRKWQAKIYFQNKAILLGYFDSEIEAAKAYDAAAKKYHGEFARLNFPETLTSTDSR